MKLLPSDDDRQSVLQELPITGDGSKVQTNESADRRAPALNTPVRSKGTSVVGRQPGSKSAPATRSEYERKKRKNM